MKPFAIFLRILTIVAVAEALVMVVFGLLNIHGLRATLSDSVLLSIISAPFLYKWVVKPTGQELRVRLDAIDAAGEMIVITDRNGVVEYANPAFTRVTGYTQAEIIGRKPSLLKSGAHDQSFYQSLWETILMPRVWSGEMVNRRKDGTLYPEEQTITPVMDAKGRVIRFVAIKRDITERKRAEEEIKHLAYYDTLTDLPNRTLLRDDLQSAILTAQSGGHRVGLLLMDLDRFKEINDALGHDRGDVLLRQVAQRLRNAVWDTDRAARLGGDEFAVLLPRLAASEQIMEHINVVIQRILTALEAPFMIEGLPVAVEASIGAALYPYHGTDADRLMQHADVAMYTAKESGSGYAVYIPDQEKYSPRGLTMMGELRQAIEGNQLVLHYQPKVNMKTGRVFGVEALVRWRHPVYGFIPPDQFIEPAEQTELIKPLTRWVFDTAQKQCLAWHRAGYDCTVSINLSARNLHDTKLPDEIAGLLKAGDGRPDRLQMEITETAIMVDPTRALKTIARLRAMGIRFSVDDFGIGYSSLAYIKKLPVDEIKIDKSFIINMPHNQNDAVIVRSTITMAHDLDLKVVAEGVENKDIWDRLSALGCDGAQGYYMCRPIPAEDLTRWLTESPWGLSGAA